MTHAATKWWLLGGALLVVGLGIVLYSGYRAGTFVMFGQTASRQTQPIAVNQTGESATQTVQLAVTGTCWTFASYTDQQYLSVSLATCTANKNWAGWWPSADKPYSSLGQYNPTPLNVDWSDTEGVCLLTSGQTELTNLYECITEFSAEPSLWQAHYAAEEILNPDITTTESIPELVPLSQKSAAQSQQLVTIEQTVGWCFGSTSQAGYVGRKLLSECQDLYEFYEADGDPQSLVSLWCAVPSLPNTCFEPPFNTGE